MSTKTNREKLIAVNPAKIKQAQKLLGAETAEETIERALDELIAEHERNRIAQATNEQFFKHRNQIRDISDASILGKNASNLAPLPPRPDIQPSPQPIQPTNLEAFLQTMAASAEQSPVLSPMANERAFYYEGEA